MYHVPIEGLDNRSFYTLARALEKHLTHHCTTVSFPRYDEESGSLVKKHLREYPKPDFSKPQSLFDILSYIQEKDHIFVYTMVGSDKQLLLCEVKAKGANSLVLQDILSQKELHLSLECNKYQDYTFYPVEDKNIFKHKASHLTKALLFTVDRNVWFTNNLPTLPEDAYVFVNRSYYSNFLYRTLDIYTAEDFMEYLLSIIYNEVKSVGISKNKAYYISCDNEEYMEYQFRVHAKQDGISEELVERDLQYLKTVWKSYSHYKHLLILLEEKYPSIWQKYKDFLQMHEIQIRADYFKDDLLQAAHTIYSDVS